jgi:hypothetical protein
MENPAGLTAILLIALLVVKELASASLRRKWRTFAAYLNVAVVPLLIIFLVNVTVRLYTLLQ